MTTLQEELQAAIYAGKTDSECLALLTDKNIIVPTNISSHDIKAYLSITGKLLAIKESGLESARNAWLNLAEFPVYDMGNPLYATAINATLDAVLNDGIITLADKIAILDMGEKLISRAEQLNLTDLRIGQITTARII